MVKHQVYFKIANPTRVAMALNTTHVGCDTVKKKKLNIPKIKNAIPINSMITPIILKIKVIFTTLLISYRSRNYSYKKQNHMCRSLTPRKFDKCAIKLTEPVLKNDRKKITLLK